MGTLDANMLIKISQWRPVQVSPRARVLPAIHLDTPMIMMYCIFLNFIKRYWGVYQIV